MNYEEHDTYGIYKGRKTNGMGEKPFAVPWHALKLDTEQKRFVLKLAKESLDDAPVLNKNDWPDMEDPTRVKSIHAYYGTKPYSVKARI